MNVLKAASRDIELHVQLLLLPPHNTPTQEKSKHIPVNSNDMNPPELCSETINRYMGGTLQVL